MTRRVAVIGAGITGLAAAHALATSDIGPEVVVLEASDRVGGALRTEPLAGIPVESGADAFITRERDAAHLARTVGLGDDLVGPAARGVALVIDGRLHPLPEGVVLGVPTSIWPVLRSGALPLRSGLRAALDLVLPRRVDPEHATVGELVRARLGDEVAERLVDPLLAGVYAGDLDRLDAVSATPQIVDAVRTKRSVILGMRASRRRSASAQPQDDDPFFLTVRGGIERLAVATREAAEATGGVEVRMSEPARAVTRRGDRVAIATDHGEVEADAVVVAVPAYAAARIVTDLLPGAAGALRGIPYASVAVVALVLPPGTGPSAGSGLLLPRREGRLVKAATWVTNKWPHLTDDGRVVVRASVGRQGDERALALGDSELVARVREELAEVVGLDAEPVATRVTRWEDRLPQYEVGHRERLAAIGEAVHDHGWIAFAGAAYRGIGIAACVRQGGSAARRVLAHLRGHA